MIVYLTTYQTHCEMVVGVAVNGCCSQVGMQYFYRKLQITTVEDFEIRNWKSNADKDIATKMLELFVVNCR